MIQELGFTDFLHGIGATDLAFEPYVHRPHGPSETIYICIISDYKLSIFISKPLLDETKMNPNLKIRIHQESIEVDKFTYKRIYITAMDQDYRFLENLIALEREENNKPAKITNSKQIYIRKVSAGFLLFFGFITMLWSIGIVWYVIVGKDVEDLFFDPEGDSSLSFFKFSFWIAFSSLIIFLVNKGKLGRIRLVDGAPYADQEYEQD